MRRTIIACVIVALVAGATSATAAKLITSADIKNNSITGADIHNPTITHKDIKKGTIIKKKLSKAVRDALENQGAAGPRGPQGPKGEKGDTGPTQSAGNWGIINRNATGSPDIELRAGPNVLPASAPQAQRPPNGRGSLNFTLTGTEKAAFGNEVDWTGSSFDSINVIGFWVFQVGENVPPATNLPNIQIEVDPNRAGIPSNFSTLSFVPPAQGLGWSPFINATTTGLWFGTGAAFAGTACDPGGSLCSWDTLTGLLDDGGDAATILSVSVSKGTDNAWHGAIDALRVNGTIYDFEEHGVVERNA